MAITKRHDFLGGTVGQQVGTGATAGNDAFDVVIPADGTLALYASNGAGGSLMEITPGGSVTVYRAWTITPTAGVAQTVRGIISRAGTIPGSSFYFCNVRNSGTTDGFRLRWVPTSGVMELSYFDEALTTPAFVTLWTGSTQIPTTGDIRFELRFVPGTGNGQLSLKWWTTGLTFDSTPTEQTSHTGLTTSMPTQARLGNTTSNNSGTTRYSYFALADAGGFPTSAPAATLTFTNVTVPAGVTVEGAADATTALGDADAASQLVVPNGGTVDCTLRRMTKPAGDFVLTFEALHLNATSGSMVPTLRSSANPGAVLATGSTLTATGTAATATVTFTAASITGVTSAQWERTDGNTLFVRLEATAA